MDFSKCGDRMEERDILPVADELSEWLSDALCSPLAVLWFPGSAN